VVAFVGVRLAKLGDPAPYRVGPSTRQTLMSFFDVEKYPPSLCFVLVTLGLLALLYALLGRRPSRLAERDPLLVFGRVPMFFYVVHLFAIHGAARGISLWLHGPAGERWPGLQWGLPAVYAVWLVALAVFYPACRRYGQYKATHRAWWLSYL
jgi:uncharacterized membrane protein